MVRSVLVATLLLALEVSNAYQVLECQNGYEVSNTEKSGEIVSPGYTSGQKYPNNFHCQFKLRATWGTYIRLTFEDFDIEPTTNCEADVVAVIDNSDPILLCGRTIPKPFTSRGTTLQVVFKTDPMRTARGFKARFETVSLPTSCNSTSDFECGDRSCVPKSRVCDGRFDCIDGSDEGRCPGRPLPKLIPNANHCGKTPISPDTSSAVSRIIAGRPAVKNSWPWQASIQIIASQPHGHFCGGSLMNNYWVVTAGHCLAVPDSKIIVRLGAHDLNASPSGEQWRPVERSIRHPKYSPEDMSFDIALIKLKIPVNYTDTVQPVCMPPTKAQVLHDNQTCFTTGWGMTRGSGYSKILKQTALHVQTPEHCKGDPMDFPYSDPDSVVCATEVDGFAGPCHGDSGGPFVCQETNGDWMLHGATSYGTKINGLTTICGMGTHTVWNRIAHHLEWINNNMKFYS